MRQLRVPITARILAVSGASLGIFALSLLYVVRRTIARAVYAETETVVEVALRGFWNVVRSKGRPTIVDGHLMFGDWDPGADHVFVDNLKQLTGAEATIFQIVDGKPVRLTTTIDKPDGSGRNIGTELLGPARQAFERGEDYVGTGPVAGRQFVNRYDVLRDPGGNIVGLFYAGVPLSRMHEAAREAMNVVIGGTAIAMIPALAALYVITRPVDRTFMRVVSIAQGLARGDVDQQADRSFINDELADVNAAFTTMIAYLQRMSAIADAISEGDFSNEVEPASSVDRLGNALAKMTLNLRDLFGRLESSALTDNLTQLGNRRSFDLHLESEISRITRHGGVLSLATIDVDRFKAVNDERGHAGGDNVLMKLADILRAVRLEDAGYRLGGDEFALLFPNTSALDAQIVMERVREKVLAQLSGTTVSIGIAASVGGIPDAKTLQQRADEALYLAKEQGRNAVVVSGEPPRSPHSAEVTQLRR